VVLASDGSDLSINALKAGAAVVPADSRFVIVTVMHDTDPMLMSGAGIAGGVATPEEVETLDKLNQDDANEVVMKTRAGLGMGNLEAHVLRGEVATAVCEFAKEHGAAAIVIGSRGRGGFKRAILGSVSDFVVRHAPCPVIVTGHEVAD
jgi:nucleotide-binding universal stress UspA family protein